MTWKNWLIPFSIVGCIPAVALAEPLILSPQFVVDRTLTSSVEAKNIETKEALQKRSWYQARSKFDNKFTVNGSYEISKSESLTQVFSNDEDRTQSYGFGFSQKLPTGTNLEFTYARQTRSSELNSFAQANGLSPDWSLDTLALNITQELWQNLFGKADRLAVEVARENLKNASLQKIEDYEQLVLTALNQFWAAYVAQQNLQHSLASRDRFRNLVQTVQNKSKLGFTAPGELAQSQADLEEQEQRVKSASFTYLSAVDLLFKTLQMDPPSDVTFKVEDTLPAKPKEQSLVLDTNRSIQLAKQKLNMSQLELESVESQQSPALNLVAEASLTGGDAEPSEAFSEALSGTRPIYSVGLQFATSFGSNLRQGELAHFRSQVMEKEYALKIAKDQLSVAHLEAQREVNTHFKIAESASRQVSFRDKAVKEFERAYRQGRTDIFNVIQAYNSLFTNQTKAIRAIGDYHIALNKLAAIQDELIKIPQTEIKGR